MKVPIKVSPNPLITTAVEVRFILMNPNANFASTLIPHYINEFPKLDTFIPATEAVKKKQPHLEFMPMFRLKSDAFSVSFSNKSILLEPLGEYPLWPTYFNFIKKQLEKLFALNSIDKVLRIGVRYGSVFENAEISEALSYYPQIKMPGFKEKIQQARFELVQDKIEYILQLGENVQVAKAGKIFYGLWVDVDASSNNELKGIAEVLQMIDTLHTGEKNFFFNQLLKADFVNTLNPEY